MSCRKDVRKAILKDITNRFVAGRNTYELTTDDTITIVNQGENTDSKAKKASQARAIATNLADRIAEYTNNHVMGSINEPSRYDPYRVTLHISPAYIENEYRKLPQERQDDPADMEIPEEYRKIIQENKNQLKPFDKMMIESNPLVYLEQIAQQSYGIADNFSVTPIILSNTPILEVAQAMFPFSGYVHPEGLPAINPECAG